MNNTWVNYAAVLAIPAYFFNDILALISIAGSLIRFLGAFPNSPCKRLIPLAEWHIAPLILGSVFQFAFLAIGMTPETPSMGILVPMSPWLVTGLFALSFVLLLGSRWVKNQKG